jgi:hypothetical protein
MINNQDQISRLTEPDNNEPLPDDGVSPRMPFDTAYMLTRDQEEELVNHAMRRKDELEAETGRNVCGAGEWWKNDGLQPRDPQGRDVASETWMGKRLLYDKMFKNEMDWRPRILKGIFIESNLVIPAARRICRQMIARGVNYFFGTSPWFAVYPTGQLDKTRADKADRYIRWKTDAAKLQRTEEQAIERAFVLGEGVVKTSWAKREQIYKTRATVLVDEQGMDILGADGDYILQDDLWIPDQVTDSGTGQTVTSELMVLKRDGKTPQPKQLIWQEKYITRRIVHYKGPEADVVNFMDFLCPLDAKNIQAADCVIHLYDESLMSLADRWKKSIAENSNAEERVLATRKAMELIRALATGSGQTTSGQNSDVVDKSSKGGSFDTRRDPVIEVAEFHLRYDIDGDGLRDIMLIVDCKSRMPIFYDYEANVTPEGLRPFSCVRVNEVPGRWYGIGAMEMFNPSQMVVDLWMNRKNFAAGNKGRIDLWSPHNTLEGRANPRLNLNWGGVFTPLPGKKKEDILESIYLQDNIGDTLQAMIEFVLQFMTNESGVANANDSRAAGLDTGELATGIKNIEKSGQELFSLFLGHLEPGVNETLIKMCKLVLGYLDQMEVYRYFEEGEAGGEGGQELREINPGDIANIEIDTRILLERHRGEQILESNMQCVKLLQIFDTLPFERQQACAEMFSDMAKALQIKNADKVFIPLQTQPTGGGGGPDPRALAASAAQSPRQGVPNL